MLNRLLRPRLRYALLAALPFQVLALLVIADGNQAWSSYIDVAKKLPESAANVPPFDLEQWRWFARDRLQHRLAWVRTPEPPTDGPLESYRLAVAQYKIDRLDSDLPDSGRGDTKAAQLQTPDGVLDVKVRYIGDNAWHWLFRQKSWRVKLKGDESWRDRQVFAFKNPPAMLTIDEPVVADIAHAMDLLAPDVRPVQLFVNDAYAGLYLYWDVADESLLRRALRMPGSLYSGDGAPADAVDGVSSLFRDAKLWEKDASRNAERQDDRSEIVALLDVLGRGDPAAFLAFAEQHLDLDRFARYIAIDRAFGCGHHDYHHNHKLYFDPYRGRFEPILWDVSDWGQYDDPEQIDDALNPLLVALLQSPNLRLLIQRTLHAQLQGELQPDRVAERLHKLDAATRAARAADCERDTRTLDSAALMLPLMGSRYYTLAEYDQALQQTIAEYRARNQKLGAMLADTRLRAHWQPAAAVATLDLGCDGRVGADWQKLHLVDAGDHPFAREVAVRADRNRNGRLDDDDPIVATGRGELALHEFLAPGLRQQPQSRNVLLFGTFDLVPAEQHYRYFVVGDGLADARIRLDCTSAVDGRAIAVADAAAIEPVADLVSAHPWSLPQQPTPREVVFGPGDVSIDGTQRFDAATTVRFLPGTTVHLAKDATMLCRGKVFAQGTEAEPIRFAPATDAAWGCLGVQGMGTAGSRFAWCSFAGGAAVDIDMLQLTGMVNVADTRDIEFDHCNIGKNAAGDDAMHWGYVQDGKASNCSFTGALSDGFDLDLCRGIAIADCTFTDTGNDGVDLMTCDVTIERCRFTGCGDKGISVGEATTLRLSDNRYSRCTIGVQVKDGSQVTAKVMRMDNCGTGLSLYRKNHRYSSGSRIVADELQCNGVKVPVECAPSCQAVLAAVIADGRRIE